MKFSRCFALSLDFTSSTAFTPGFGVSVSDDAHVKIMLRKLAEIGRVESMLFSVTRLNGGSIMSLFRYGPRSRARSTNTALLHLNPPGEKQSSGSVPLPAA